MCIIAPAVPERSYTTGCGCNVPVRWASNTPGNSKQCSLQLLPTGNLQLTDQKRVLWETKSSAVGNRFWLWVQSDGNLVLYQGVCCSGKSVWSSNTADTASCSPSDETLTRSISQKYKQHMNDTTAAPPAIEHALTTNQDFFIANKAFFFDLDLGRRNTN
jgi:hypothetical protein